MGGVIHAVEGVQAQTKILMQAIKEHRLPAILFINKMDRIGADYKKICDSVKTALDVPICELCEVYHEGTAGVQIRQADPQQAGWTEVLALNNDDLLHRFAHDIPVSNERLTHELRQQARRGLVYPLFVGSAAKGIGIDPLLSSLSEFFPVTVSSQKANNPLSGVVFKIIKQASGRQEAYIRLFDGQLRSREEVPVISSDNQTAPIKMKQLYMLQDGKHIPADTIMAGDIWVLSEEVLTVGDCIGTFTDKMKAFPSHSPPMRVQVQSSPTDANILHQVLTHLTREDPNLHYIHDQETGEKTIALYGRVQQEILAETIRQDYGIETVFSAPQVICIEKPISTGEAVETMGEADNPFWATVGFRVEPGIKGSGLQYRLAVELGSLPLSFQKAIQETVMETLREGLVGWRVTDIIVTLTQTGYASALSTAKDFRSLTPLVLMQALKRAGTRAYEPVNDIQMQFPEKRLSNVLSLLSVWQGTFQEPQFQNSHSYLNGTIPVRNAEPFKSAFHSLTRGEGLFTMKPGGYIGACNQPPQNQRRQLNPLNRSEYLMKLNHVM